jgi:nicotinate-nucleotide adenylyltransferase
VNLVSQMRTVVLGGTFDPPHQGHVSVISYLLGHFDQVVIAPTSQNPYKARSATSLEIRIQMIRLVLSYEKLLVTKSVREVGIFVSEFPYLRTWQFVDHWKELAGVKPTWAVGPDVAPQVASWERWEEMKLEIFIVPEIVPVRATDVRSGSISAHPALGDFIQKNIRYGRE